MKREPTLAKLHIDLEAVIHNFNKISGLLKPDTEIMPVIKANGYGLGSTIIAQALSKKGVKIFAVADCMEAVQLRNGGIKEEIVLLYQPSVKEIDSIIEGGFSPAACDLSFLEKLNHKARNKNKIVKVHIEIETGTGRLGIIPEEAVKFFKKVLEFKNIKAEGIFMHYASSDSIEAEEVEYAKAQTKIFNSVIEELKENDIGFKYIHASCSGGILNYEEAHYNLVRPGLILYGYYPNTVFKEKINLKPSLKLFTEVIFIKEVPEGTNIGYSFSYTKRKEKVKLLLCP